MGEGRTLERNPCIKKPPTLESEENERLYFASDGIDFRYSHQKGT